MTLKDILPDRSIDCIEVRTNNPFGGDMLFGFCSWDGRELRSLDGDSYFLGESVERCEFDDEKYAELTIWIHSDWEEG